MEIIESFEEQHIFMCIVMDEHTITVIRAFGDNYNLERDN